MSQWTERYNSRRNVLLRVRCRLTNHLSAFHCRVNLNRYRIFSRSLDTHLCDPIHVEAQRLRTTLPYSSPQAVRARRLLRHVRHIRHRESVRGWTLTCQADNLQALAFLVPLVWNMLKLHGLEYQLHGPMF